MRYVMLYKVSEPRRRETTYLEADVNPSSSTWYGRLLSGKASETRNAPVNLPISWASFVHAPPDQRFRACWEPSSRVSISVSVPGLRGLCCTG